MTPKKLPVFKTVGNAFGTAFFPPIFGTRFFFGYFLLIFLWSEVVGFVNGLLGTLDHPVAQQIASVVWIPLIAPFAVSVHRHIILHEAIPTLRRLLGSFFSKRNMTFAGYMFLISAPFMILQLLSQLPRLGFSLQFGLFGFAMIPYVIFVAGFIIFLPFIAIDSMQTFGRCWERTKGNILRVFFATAIVGAVLTTVWLIFLRPLQEMEIAFAGAVTIFGLLVIDAVISTFLLIWAALAVAVVSYVFVFLSTDEEREMNKTTRINEMSYKLWDKY